MAEPAPIIKTGLTGGCACGAVRYASGSSPVFSLHCQCRRCQRASGTGHGTSVVVPAASLSVSGELRYYESTSDSGNIVGRGFCPICGSPVLNRNSGYPDMRYIHVGSLDDPSGFKADGIVFSEFAQPWDRIDTEPK